MMNEQEHANAPEITTHILGYEAEQTMMVIAHPK